MVEVPQSVEIARQMGYQALIDETARDKPGLGSRSAVLVIVDYEGRSRFDPAQDSYVTEFMAHQHDAVGIVAATDVFAPRLCSILERLNMGLWRVGSGGMPAIVRLSGAEADPPEQQRVDLIARRIVEDVFGPTLFREGPGIVVICVDNFTDEGGAHRHGTVSTDAGPLTLNMVFVGHRSSLQLKMHELLHAFGAVDVYGHDGQRNARHSLMSASAGAGDRSTLLPDPWHRMAMGLCNPDIWEIRGYLAAQSSFTAALSVSSNYEWPALVIWDQAHGVNEYFVVELRSSDSLVEGVALDSATASGFVVWSVKVGPSGKPVDIVAAGGGWNKAVLTLGSKGDLELGGWDPWVPSSGSLAISTPPLNWLDGTPAGFTLTLSLAQAGDFSSGTVTLEPHIRVVAANPAGYRPDPIAEPVVEIPQVKPPMAPPPAGLQPGG